MIIYPAIDLRGGKVVRLKEGDPERQTVFSSDPLQIARQWIEQGATWLHLVNLDGAFSKINSNGHILDAIAQLGVNVQFGGGLRQISDIEHAIDHGAARVVLGTVAVQNSHIVEEAVRRWGSERICVALDSRDGKVTTHGWQIDADVSPVELGSRIAGYGIQHVLYTDVKRDGGLQGVNVAATITLAQETNLKVIASGGVGSIADIQGLYASHVVAGAIIGMALYEGYIQLGEAITVAEGKNAG